MSTRENVLKALEENKGSAVSGEELANRLSISRAAVWKAIQELRREGYRIDAITNKGYSLAPDSDVLSSEGILPYVRTGSMAGRIHVFKSVESTNLTAKKMALDGAAAGTVVIAEEQSKGRGRMGRSFFSPPAGGIYMSFILRPGLDNAKSVLITTAASVAVCKAIENVTGISCRIKWVNDVYKGEKKICGILTEAATDFESGRIDYIVLGIGINYNTPQAAFPAELAGVAGSLFEEPPGDGPEDASDTSLREINKQSTRNRLIAEVINQMLEINDKLETREFIREYKNRSFVLGKEILIIPAAGSDKERDLTEGIPATAVDIDGDGGLVVRHLSGGLQTLKSGEISIRTIK
ncbi:MAG TPA: biotin--[acetyl-CoA-carboxylase] ligase [Anaerovoracaceae bacterium]|nr:biotin--[acetyl-CoA-carboxylase] ligase [Anaerovoracaceae bacterium]